MLSIHCRLIILSYLCLANPNPSQSLTTLSSYNIYNIFVVNFSGSFLLLKSLSSTISIFSCLLISVFILPSNSSKASPVFFRFSFLSYVSSPSAINPFHCTKYFLTSLIFFLFKILSTSHSSAPSTSIGFPSSFFCPFTCSYVHASSSCPITHPYVFSLRLPYFLHVP